MSGSGTGIVTPYGTHRGIDFDGAADYYTRGADLTGLANGPLGILSSWFRVDGGDGGTRFILVNTSQRFFVALSNVNRLWIRGQTVAPATILELLTTPTYLAGSGWHHVAAAWDLTVPSVAIYVDGAVPALTTNTALVGNLDYTSTNWAVAANVVGGNPWDGAAEELYFNSAETIALGTLANREQFRHPNGQPPSLLADASGPTATQPIGYFVEVAGAMMNLGSGGAFVAAGAPALNTGTRPNNRWIASLIHNRRRRRVSAY